MAWDHQQTVHEVTATGIQGLESYQNSNWQAVGVIPMPVTITQQDKRHVVVLWKKDSLL